jgi:hypothetical protein
VEEVQGRAHDAHLGGRPLGLFRRETAARELERL